MTSKKNNPNWIWANWPVPEHIHAGTSTRTGGYSQHAYSTLNLAEHVGDQKDNVEKNRALLSTQLNLSSTPYWLNQTHSNQIVCLDNNIRDLNADGACTSLRNHICTILTADCVPLLFCNKQGTLVTAIHAGWKGICKGIIENAIDLYPSPAEIMVWIGPCIKARHYEVGVDVFDSCLNHLSSLQTAFTQKDDLHWLCDLIGLVKIILQKKQVGAIYECGLCTYEQDELFYSYRRDGITGRTASMIWME